MLYKNSTERFREIVKIMAYYGFGFLVDAKFKKDNKSPQNLRKAFEKLGPTFIKIGQILSTRPDILPAEYINELIKLQDRVPSEDFENINKIFIEEFKQPAEELFAEFDKTPLASASIAQVYRAKLKDGRKVIVKVQRPHIAEKMHMDLAILHKIVILTKARFNDSLVNPREALEELISSTEKELDFGIEASNIERFGELNSKVPYVYVPFIVKDMCSKKIITMEEISGTKISESKVLIEKGLDLDKISKNFILSFFKQIFEDGFFHGDPHPGNVLVKEDKICFIDFGIMGELPQNLRNALNEIIISAVFNDVNRMISVLMTFGVKTGHVNRSQLYEDVDYFFASYLSASLNSIKVSQILQEIIEVSKRNNIKMPKELTILARSMIMVEGVAAKLSPEINMLDIAKPYVAARLRKSQIENFSLEDIASRAFSFTKDSSRLPSKLIELSESIIRGRTKVQLEHKDISGPINELHKMINRLVAALIISSMIIGSSYILSSNIGTKIYNMSVIGLVGYAIAAVMGFWLLISIIRSGKL